MKLFLTRNDCEKDLEPENCQSCYGTGEGYTSDSRCSSCGGSGISNQMCYYYEEDEYER